MKFCKDNEALKEEDMSRKIIEGFRCYGLYRNSSGTFLQIVTLVNTVKALMATGLYKFYSLPAYKPDSSIRNSHIHTHKKSK